MVPASQGLMHKAKLFYGSLPKRLSDFLRGQKGKKNIE
jgi:hypothetical protein